MPRFFRRLKRHDGAERTLMTRFSYLALWAGANIVKNVGVETRAKEMATHVYEHLVVTRMTSQRRIVNFTKQELTERRVVREIHTRWRLARDNQVTI